MVLGASASGATVYAEPAPAVALNNAEARLSGAEAAEEAAILRRLTRTVLQHSARLRQVCHELKDINGTGSKQRVEHWSRVAAAWLAMLDDALDSEFMA